MGNWLALRGLGRESAHWLDFADKFQAKTSRLLTLDLPGSGTRLDQKSPITIAGITDKVRDQFLQQREGAAGPWNVLGISLGGMVALDWVHRYPYDFQSAVVMNTSSKDTGPFLQRLTVFGLYKLFQAFTSKDLRRREKAIIEMISNLKKDDEAVLDRFVEIAELRSMSLQNVSRQVMAASQFVAPDQIKIPLLVLASLKDHMVDVRCSKMLADRFSAQIKFHPEAGHELSLDDPDWVVERVLDFQAALTKVEAQPS